MNLLPRRRTAEAVAETPVVETSDTSSATKGRPTPKRRDSAPRRAPITAPPQTRRESLSWQKQQAKAAKTSPTRVTAGTPARGTAEHRDALKRGDEAVLPKRDKGPVRRLARDWVDSRRMISNWMLILFPLMILGFQVPYVNFIVLAFFFVILGEWFITGRNILALAKSRGLETKETPITIGFYAGSRSYLPRRWRLPQSSVQRGDAI